MEHKCESAAPARPDYVGRHRLFRKVRIEGGNYGYRLEPVLYGGDPLYVPRHYRNPATQALLDVGLSGCAPHAAHTYANFIIAGLPRLPLSVIW